MAKRLPSNRKISVILLQKMKHLGDMYDTVAVAPVYARNVLIPSGVARIATALAYNDLKGKIEKHQKKTAQYVSGVEQFLAKLDQDKPLQISRKVNEQQHLYAKVSSDDVADLIKTTFDLEVDPDHLTLPHKLDTLGLFQVVFDYKGIKKNIALEIKAEQAE